MYLFLLRHRKIAAMLSVGPLALFLVSVTFLIIEGTAPLLQTRAWRPETWILIERISNLTRFVAGGLLLVGWIVFLIAARKAACLTKRERILWYLVILSFPWVGMPYFLRRIREADSAAKAAEM